MAGDFDQPGAHKRRRAAYNSQCEVVSQGHTAEPGPGGKGLDHGRRHRPFDGGHHQRKDELGDEGSEKGGMIGP